MMACRMRVFVFFGARYPSSAIEGVGGSSNRIADWSIDLDLNADDLPQRLRTVSFVESVDRSSCVTTDGFVRLAFDLLV